MSARKIRSPHEAHMRRLQAQTLWLLREKIKSLRETLRLQPLLQKAKGVLMAHHNCTDVMALEILERMSQENGISLRDVCQSVIRIRPVLNSSIRSTER